MPQRIPLGYTAFSLQLRHTLSPRPSFITGGHDIQTADWSDPLQRDAAADIMINVLAGTMDSNVNLGPVTWRVGPYPPEALLYVSPNQVVGEIAFDTPPPNVNVLVALSTARGGRRGRGRWFLPWAVPETTVNEIGIISVAQLLSNNTVLEELVEALLLNGTQLVVLHTWDPAQGEDPDVGGAPNDVLTAIAQPLVGSQRRRLGR